MASFVGSKRKRVVLSVEDKLKVCELNRKKVPRTEIMHQFNIGLSTVKDILKSEEKLKSFKLAKTEMGISKSTKTVKSMKTGMFAKLDDALYIWFRQQREKGVPITGPILLEKASEFHSLLYPETPERFTASTGFQWRFCQRYGIKSLSIAGEKLSADLISADEFVNSFAGLTEGYSADQIFNCDETGLYYKMLPGKTLATVHSGPSGAKKAKERVTINACANVTGTVKLPLLFIGKAKNPRCFKGIDKNMLPVIYRNQANAWVTTGIFQDWFDKNFVPFVEQKLIDMGVEPKALLLLDNCSAHPSEDELVSSSGLITAKFLPPNVTALIQPMDQGVLESIKRRYRKSILRDLVSHPELDMLPFLKSINMLKVVERIATAWDQTTPDTIRKSWQKLIPLETENEEPAGTGPTNDEFVAQFSRLSMEVTSQEISAWFNSDGPGYEHLNEQGIVELLTADPNEECDEEDGAPEPDHSVNCPISHMSAMKMFDDCLTWLRHQPEATLANTSTLVALRELASEKRAAKQKQTTLTSWLV